MASTIELYNFKTKQDDRFERQPYSEARIKGEWDRRHYVPEDDISQALLTAILATTSYGSGAVQPVLEVLRIVAQRPLA